MKIPRKEDEKVEFKKSLAEMDEICKTIVAFSNADGGRIFVGVNDDGTVTGIETGKSTVAELLNTVKGNIDPPIIPQIEEIEIDGKKVLVISVNAGLNKPYFYKGVAYKRVGSTNQRMSREEIIRSIVENFGGAGRYEDIPVEVGAEEISEKIIEEFVTVARERRGLEMLWKNKEDFLRKLGLVKNGNLTVAGLLFFHEKPQFFIPHAFIKAGKFEGGRIVEEREIWGNLVNQIGASISFLSERLSFSYSIGKDGTRREIYEIPIGALREAVVNAVAHRDYSMASPIYIRIFPEKIEIENPGRLPPGITVEDLKRDHISILRNPKIAHLLFLYGYIERWGRGTNRMIELCREAGIKDPEFVETETSFKVIFWRKEISEIERKIINMAKYGITSREISERLGISGRTARLYLKNLVDRGILRRKREGRRVVYYS